MAHCLRLGLLVALLAGGNVAHALTPGPTIVRECPHCQKQILQFTIGSGNTMGAHWWTDGFMRAPMLPFMPRLVKCADCQKLVWFEDAKELGKIEFFASDDRWKKAKSPLDAVESDYLAAAALTGLARERELHARQRAWWLANEAARNTNHPPTEWTEPRKKNLDRLSTLLDEHKDNELIQKAEIARELGRLEDCLKLLKQPVGEGCANTARQLTILAHQKKTRVEELLPDDPPRKQK